MLNLLLTYLLVNLTWRVLARKELYAELFVRNSDQAAAALLVEGACGVVKGVHLGRHDGNTSGNGMGDQGIKTVKLFNSVKVPRLTSVHVNIEDLPSLACRFKPLRATALLTSLMLQS